MKISEKLMQKRFVFFAAIAALALLFWSSVLLQKIFFQSVEEISGFINKNRLIGIAIFVGLGAFSAMLSPFSSIPLVPLAVAIFGNLATASLLIIGWLIGDTIAYLIGSSAGHKIIGYFVPFEKIEYYKNKIPKRSELWLILIFRLALPAEITGYVLGIARYNFLKYLLVSFLAETPFAFIATYSSAALLEHQPARFIFFIALAITLVWLTLYIFHKKTRD